MSEFANDKLSSLRARGAGSLKYLPGAFLLACLAVGLPLALWPPQTRTPPRQQNVANGAWARSFETTLDEQLPLREAGVRLWATIDYRLFHEGRAGMLVGTDGWLYTAEEFQLNSGAEREVARKLAYIRDVRGQLRRGGAELIVALVPAKARVYPEHLGSHALPAYNRPVYGAFAARLRSGGVAVADVLTALRRAKARGPVFLRTDTHWTPLGAQAAAAEVARAVRGAFPALDLPRAAFKTIWQPAAPRGGDLLRYLPVSANLAPKPDVIRTPTTEREGGGDLLGDPEVPVTLVGTSYSANATWDFAGALKQALAADVLNVAREGKGPVVPMREYLRSRERREHPPRLVIWEIPERFLSVADKE